VRRRDLLSGMLADVACALNWFNPLVWLLARQLRAEAETACDDVVILAGIDAEAYASELLALARQYNGTPLLTPAIGITGASDLRDRIRAILGDRRMPGGTPAMAVAAIFISSAAIASAVFQPVPAQNVSREPRWLNISDGGPEISSNSAGLQARWNDRGRHSALFLTGAIDLTRASSGRVAGDGNLVLVEETGRAGDVRVFEWRSTSDRTLPGDVRRSLGVGARQLARLTGRGDAGYPGSTLSGLPAVSNDPSAQVVQAGWQSGDERFGVAIRGTWQRSNGVLASSDAAAWCVVFAVDRRSGQTRRVQISTDAAGLPTPRSFVNGVESAADDAAKAWAVDALRNLQAMAPEFVRIY
jgi:hypothetical protein